MFARSFSANRQIQLPANRALKCAGEMNHVRECYGAREHGPIARVLQLKSILSRCGKPSIAKYQALGPLRNPCWLSSHGGMVRERKDMI